MNPKEYIKEAIKLSEYAVEHNKGGPFGAIIVKDDRIVSKAYNQVTSTNNPTAHAEILAIEKACKKLKTFDLSGCEMYTSCEPCPMCLGACYWANIDKVYFANSREDAKEIGFDDDLIYRELCLPKEKRALYMEKLKNEEAMKVFEAWQKKKDKIKY